jgi:hypothetical protein
METVLNSSELIMRILMLRLIPLPENLLVTEFVQDTVSECEHLGTPSMALWGREETSPTAVQDCSGLCCLPCRPLQETTDSEGS